MKHFSEKFLEIMKWVNDGLPDSDEGHSREFGHLTSFQIDRAKKATSTMNEVLNYAIGNHFTDLNMTAQQVANVYFAGVDKTGEKAENLGLAYKPELAPLGRWGGEGSHPRPTMLLCESGRSSRCAVLLISWGEMTVKGYGDWDTADFHLLAVERDHDDAVAVMRGVTRAFSDLEQLAELSADYAERGDRYDEGGTGDF